MHSFIGHASIRERLEKFLSHKNGSRTFLFYGPKYVGKGTLARFFAGAFVRGDRKLDFSLDRFGVVEDCIEIVPEREEKKGVIKEKPIDIKRIREGIRKISFSSFHNGRKALIIDEAQNMTVSAQNALLKTLEEPIGTTVIILVAHTMDTLVPTLLSRCSLERFGMVSKEAFAELIPSKHAVESEHLRRLSLGLPGFAIRIMREKNLFRERAHLEQQALFLENMGVGERLRLGEELAKNIPQAIETLELWEFIFRERALSGEGDIRQMFSCVEKMYECVKLLKRTQINARLILENTILNI